MSERLQWILELGDRLSGPAARMEKQLAKVRGELKTMDIAAKASKIGPLADWTKRHRLELQLERAQLMQSRSALEKKDGALQKLAHPIKALTGHINANRAALRDWLLISAPLVYGFGFVANRATEMGKAIARAVSFKQSSMIGLKTFLGGSAGNVFETMSGFAGRIGEGPEKLVGTARMLAAAGYSARHIEPMVKRLADLDTIMPGAGGRVGGIIASLGSEGVGRAGHIEALAGTGLNVGKAFEDLAYKLYGVRNRHVGKALAENPYGLDPNLVSRIIFQQIDKLNGGAAGSKALAGGRTLEGKFKNVETQRDRMFSKLSGSSGVQALGKVLDNLAALFNPTSTLGKTTFDRLTKMSDLFAKFLEPLTGKDGRTRMEAFFDSMASKIEKSLGFIGDLVAGVRFLTGGGTDYEKKALKELFLEPHGSPDPVGDMERKIADRRASRQAMLGTLPGARPMDNTNRGFAGAEVNVTQHITINGGPAGDPATVRRRFKQDVKEAMLDVFTEE